MRLALLVNPAASDQKAASWLLGALQDRAFSLLLLPESDPLVAALSRELAPAEAADDRAILVLARGGVGVLDEPEWQALGMAARARPLEVAPRGAADSSVDATIAEGASAEALLATDLGPRHVEGLLRLAEIEALRGGQADAISLLDRALAIAPMQPTALERRIELARASGDAATAAALRRRLLSLAQSDEQRATLLSSIADESLVATAEALERALTLRPRDPRLLERLQAVMEAAGRWREAVDAKVAVSETIDKPRDRARALAAAAGMCARRTNDVARAVALYEAAIADDPTTPGAFEAIERVLLESSDFSGVERAYSRQLERLAGRGERVAEAALLDKLARLRAERLNDVEGAISALERLVVVQPELVEPRLLLARLLEGAGRLELAALCLEGAAACAPHRPEIFRELLRVCDALRDVDRSYSVCAVLVQLGEADNDEQLVYRQFAPETTPRPRAALDAAGWNALAPAERDEAVSRIVQIIAPAAIELKLEELRQARRLPELDRRERQEVDRSTLSAVRAVGFAAAVLGVGVPEIYTRNVELPGGVLSVALPAPTLVLGKSLLSGRSVPELVFATARELACQQLTARLVTFYPSVVELRTLLLAAVAQVMPMSLAREALPLREGLAARLDAERRSELERAVGALHAGDGRLDLNGWMRAVEIGSCRAGLLCCGDITAAARMLAVDGRVVGKLSAAERVRDLIPFSVSEAHSRLRSAIGIEARAAIISQ